MNALKISTDVCVFCCGFIFGRKVNCRLRRKSGSQVLSTSSLATEDQLRHAGITRHCVDQLSICAPCQSNWASPDFIPGDLVYPKVC